MTSQINLFAGVLIVDIIFAPLGSPFLGLKCNRERSSHLHCLANRQIGSCLMIEEPKDLVVEVN